MPPPSAAACFWLLLLLAPLLGTGHAQSLRAGGFRPCKAEHEGQQEVVDLNGDRVVCVCESQRLIRCKVFESEKCNKALDGCHFVEDSRPSNFCAKQCRSCVANGTRHASGETWPQPGDACRVSHCFSGVVTTTRLHCPQPLCADPVREPGRCCPSCPSCQRGTQLFREGETRTDIMDPCNECACADGRLTCRRRACPVLPCAKHLHKAVRGQCCPVCARRHESSRALGGMCRFEDRVFGAGGVVRPDECTRCACRGSLGMVCERETCPPLPCYKKDQIPASGDSCCPKCPGLPSPSPSPSPPSPPAPPAAHSNQTGALAAMRPSHCEHEDQIHVDGSAWTSGCTNCSCSNGETNCWRIKCPKLHCPRGSVPKSKQGECCQTCQQQEGVCTIFGDPHYQTFDGRIFNFQGSCKYKLASDVCDSSASSNRSISIRITNDARDSLAFSWLRTITIRYNGDKITLMQGMKIKVNGKREHMPYIKFGHFFIMKDGYRVIFRTSDAGVRIIWDGVSFLELSVGLQYRNRMCGLCGNFNGDPADDLQARNGELMEKGQDFGDTWRAGSLRACSVLPQDMPHHYEPQCKQTWQAKIKSDRNCNALNSTLFSSCQGVVDPSYYYNACKLDMCECPGEQCHCEVLTAYARECERMGALSALQVDKWREYTNCQNVTSFQWKSAYEIGHKEKSKNVPSSPAILSSQTKAESDPIVIQIQEPIQPPKARPQPSAKEDKLPVITRREKNKRRKGCSVGACLSPGEDGDARHKKKPRSRGRQWSQLLRSDRLDRRRQKQKKRQQGKQKQQHKQQRRRRLHRMRKKMKRLLREQRKKEQQQWAHRRLRMARNWSHFHRDLDKR